MSAGNTGRLSVPADRITLTVLGKPTGQARPRFVKATGRTYTDEKTRAAQGRIQDEWVRAGRPRLPFGPVALAVTAVVDRPKAHWRKDGALTAEGERATHPIRKPDGDNALKLVADSLTGLAYRDDVDVVHWWFVRRWANAGEAEHFLIVASRMPPFPAGVQAVRAAA